MSTLSKRTVSKEELEKLRLAWMSTEAVQKDNEAGRDLNFMVLVSRVVNGKRGRHLQSSEYLFSSEEIAAACYAYFRARGGINTVAIVSVMAEWGYTNDPADAEYYE